jgi:hypothetical protein
VNFVTNPDFEGSIMRSVTNRILMKRPIATLFLIIAILSTTNVLAQNPDDKNWSDQFGYPGIVSGAGHSVAVYKDTIYIAASQSHFSQFRSVIYVSDGKTIKPFKDSPVFGQKPDNYIFDIAFDSSGRMYITGRFDTINGVAMKNIAMWDGKGWLPMGKGIYGELSQGLKIELFKGEVHVSGNFKYAGDQVVNSIARWDGNSWHDLDSGFRMATYGIPTPLPSMCNLNDSLLFTFGEYLTSKNFSSSDFYSVALWDGNTWSKAPAKFTNTPNHGSSVFNDITVFNGEVYVSGSIDSVDGIFANGIVKWDGEKWSSLPPNNYSNRIDGLSTCKEGVYVAGLKNGALWTGSEWQQSLPGYDLSLRSYFNIGDRTFGSLPRPVVKDSSLLHIGLAEIKDKLLHPILDSTQFGVYGDKIDELVFVGDDIYILGDFIGAGTTHNKKVPMRWNGKRWISLPQTVPEIQCKNIYSDGKLLYVTGDFKSVNGEPSFGIAMWDGNKWSSLFPNEYGKDLSGRIESVTDIAVNKSGTIVFASKLNNGQNTLTLLNDLDYDNIDYNVSHFIFHDDTLFKINSTDSLFILSRWDKVNGYININSFKLLSGTLGNRYPGEIARITIHDGNIYIGGSFTYLNDSIVNSIAMWDGKKWNSLGGGFSLKEKDNSSSAKRVEQILFYDNTLYVGGYFGIAGTDTASSIAKWDGKGWASLGSGIIAHERYDGRQEIGEVRAMTIVNDKLFVAGSFSRAGGKNAHNISYYNLPPTNAVRDNKPTISLLTLSVYPNPTNRSITVAYETPITTLSISDELGRTVIERSDVFSEEVKVDCSQLSAGAYTVKAVLVDGTILTGKFLTY